MSESKRIKHEPAKILAKLIQIQKNDNQNVSSVVNNQTVKSRKKFSEKRKYPLKTL